MQDRKQPESVEKVDYSKKLASALRKESVQEKLRQDAIFKTSLKQKFLDYKSARSGFFGGLTTFIFLNQMLTSEKLQLVDDMVASIEKAKSIDELETALHEKKIKNAELSIASQKYHPNLVNKDGKPAMGEARSPSRLAETFHAAIDELTVFKNRYYK